MTVFLVRHADAKSRANWPHPDETRPLTRKGLHQAEGLVDLLRDRPIRRILSSPAVRCVETVAPLANKLGLKAEESKLPSNAAEAAKKNVYVTTVGAYGPEGRRGHEAPLVCRR